MKKRVQLSLFRSWYKIQTLNLVKQFKHIIRNTSFAGNFEMSNLKIILNNIYIPIFVLSTFQFS